MTSDVERLRRLRRLRTWSAVVLVAIPIVMVATGLAPEGTTFEVAWGLSLLGWAGLYCRTSDLREQVEGVTDLEHIDETADVERLRQLRSVRRWSCAGLLAGAMVLPDVAEILGGVAVLCWLWLCGHVHNLSEQLKDTGGDADSEEMPEVARADEIPVFDNPILDPLPETTLADLARSMGPHIADRPLDPSLLADARRLAEQGDMEAQFDVALMYATAYIPGHDSTSEAVRWFLRAAHEGHVRARLVVGIMYATGLGVQQDDEEALLWVQPLAEDGYAGGKFLLALMYEQGRGVRRDGREALYWMRSAAAQGHPDALAWMRENHQDR